MPPKPKVKKEDIVDIAFEHVRHCGWQGLTARFLAEKLGTSTKPIYFHFTSMKAVEEQVVKRAMERILAYTRKPRTNDPWIDIAVGVVMFALEEKHLFRAIFDEQHVEVRRRYSVPIWQAGAEEIADLPLFADRTADQVELIRRTRWIFTHGLASLVNVAHWPWQEDSEQMLILIIQRVSRALYNEFKDEEELIFSREYLKKKT